MSNVINLPHRKNFTIRINLLHSRDIAGSNFRSLSNIPHCCLQREVGPCFSPNVADHPLRSAKNHRLSKPLPYSLSNSTQAHFIPILIFKLYLQIKSCSI